MNARFMGFFQRLTAETAESTEHTARRESQRNSQQQWLFLRGPLRVFIFSVLSAVKGCFPAPLKSAISDPETPCLLSR